MFTERKQSSEYYQKLKEFEQFCESYTKHEDRFKESAKKIVDIFPKFDIITIEFNVDLYNFILKTESFERSCGDYIFCDFDLYKDSEFISKKEELTKLYKPRLFEAFCNGSTYNEKRINEIIQKLRYKIRDYKLGFRFTHYRAKGKT